MCALFGARGPPGLGLDGPSPSWQMPAEAGSALSVQSNPHCIGGSLQAVTIRDGYRYLCFAISEVESWHLEIQH